MLCLRHLVRCKLVGLCNESTQGPVAARLYTNLALQPKPRAKQVDMSRIMAGADYMDIEQFRVYPWSISGLESCILVQKNGLSVAFDMGYAFREAVKCQHVLISHGHIDHISGLISHAARRHLCCMRPATYYVPGALIEPLKMVASAYAQMHANDKINDIDLKALGLDDEVNLPGGYIAKPFSTNHRVPSQGYLLYKQSKQLKAEFVGMPSAEINALHKKGVPVHDVLLTPEVAYTGDTNFDVFLNPPNPDLLRVKLLITETTYIDDCVDQNGVTSMTRARDRGHIHIQEFVDNEHLFRNVGNLLLVHFSDKYSVGYIHERVYGLLPPSLQGKVHLGTYLKDKTS
ncbi:hypothetical protein NP493_210g03042 [Ridgeia piscesae]|uniref:Uncharacterized protein n=1 Tax=Ridgeia piscesae TaxID=27915 RepID=A0AAD9UE88_RIDPI|nr:hypothetical protein NP493_210g03042 [Ridgeia piscesae]